MADELDQMLAEYGEKKEEAVRKRKILVVDDDETPRRACRTILPEYDVETAASGDEALQKVSPDTHCIIMDAKMPGMDGFEISRKVQERFPDIPIIMHTAYHGEHQKRDIVEHHFFAYVEKGTDPGYLKLQVRNACENYANKLKVAEYQQNLEKMVEERTAALREAQAQLIHNEKMVSLGTLAAGVSHEINNPAVGLTQTAEQLQQAVGTIKMSYEELRTAQLKNIVELIIESVAESSGQAISPVLKQRIEGIRLREDKYLCLMKCGEYVYQQGLHGTNLSTAELRKKVENLEITLEEKNPEYRDIAQPIVRMGLNFTQLNELTSIVGWSEFQKSIAYMQSWYDIGSIIRSCAVGAERIVKITGALKEYSRKDEVPQEDIKLEDTIEQTLTILTNELKYGISIIRDFQDTPRITCYPSDLAQVWTNIIHNAVQAMKGTGTLTIATYERGGDVGISISDNGTGIPKDIQNRIFEPFFTTKEPGEGTGIGLSICYKLVEKHHGTISFVSEVGKTTFEVLLPKKAKPYISDVTNE